MAINFSERDSCALGWGDPEHSSNSQPCPSQKVKGSFLNSFWPRVDWRGPCFCLGHWLELVGWLEFLWQFGWILVVSDCSVPHTGTEAQP